MKNTDLQEYLERLKNNDPSIVNIRLERKDSKYTDIEYAISQIAIALKDNTQVTTLVCVRQHCSDDCAKSIAQIIETNKSIKTLILSGNTIENTGAQLIAQALNKNTSLTNLNLHENYIKEQGALDLAAALSAHTSLMEFTITYNNIRHNGALALDEAIKKNELICIAYYDYQSYDVKSLLESRQEYIMNLLKENIKTALRIL